MSELRKLTWRYFWQQKAKEIGIIFSIVIGVIFIPFIINRFLICKISTEFFVCGGSLFTIWVSTFLPLVIFTMLSILIGSIIKDWIKSNWKKADERARTELEKDDEELKDLNKEDLL